MDKSLAQEVLDLLDGAPPKSVIGGKFAALVDSQPLGIKWRKLSKTQKLSLFSNKKLQFYAKAYLYSAIPGGLRDRIDKKLKDMKIQ